MTSTASGPGARRSRAKRSASRLYESRKTKQALASASVGRSTVCALAARVRMRAEELGGQVVDLQAEEILDLGEEDDDGDAVGEADHHRHRDEADELPHARDAHRQQEDASQYRRPHQVGETVHGDDAIDDGDEGAGRAADLHPRATAGRGDEAGDDGGPDAGSRRTARGDGESHGQRQGENADRDAGGEILAELRPVVGGQAVQQLRVEGDLHGARSVNERTIICARMLFVNVNHMLI